MHKVQPHQPVRILHIEVAVPLTADRNLVTDELSALLSESGIANPASNILDWQYSTEDRMVRGLIDPQEDEIFTAPDLQPKRVHTEVTHEI